MSSTIGSEVAPHLRVEMERQRTHRASLGDQGTAGFIGIGSGDGTARITSWVEYRDRFGSLHPGTSLPWAVKGFFANGGRQAYVTHVGPPGASLVPSDFTRGWQAILGIEEIRVLSLPDLPGSLSRDDAAGLYAHILQGCRDRLVVVDPPPGLEAAETVEWASVLSYPNAALYAPWILVPGEEDSPVQSIPPSGHVMGTMARLEGRWGVHWPPANTPIYGAVDLAARIDDAAEIILRDARVNPLRVSPGRGVRAFGVHTLAGATVPVQRLMMAIRDTLRTGTEWVVFESRTEESRQAVIRWITSLLTGLWQRGGLAGSCPEDAFQVRCDALEGEGLLLCEVGIAPVRPGEFIRIRVAHRHEGGVSPTEGQETNLAKW